MEKLTSVPSRHQDEIAESVKVTMKALKEFYGLKAGSRRGLLQSVGAEFGHIVARNISRSKDPQTILKEISNFWNTHGLGEMEPSEEDQYTFVVRNCYDCLGVSGGDTLCGFKEGFINAILSDMTGGIGSVKETQCCGSGAESCKFHVMPFKKDA